MTVDSLSLPEARRLALAAQGFADRPVGATVGRRHLRRVLARTGLLQMDSVTVLQRAHYLPLYSRLGPYETTLLDDAAYRAPRELFEYWGHEASLIPVELHPMLRWRMEAARVEAWDGMRSIAAQQPELVDRVLAEVTARGPVSAAEIEDDAPRVTGNWGWNWSDVKRALEYLFWSGQVTAADRTPSFARRYDLPERVLPARVLDAPTPSDAEAHRALVEIAARGLGVATELDLRDYFRLPTKAVAPAVAELVEAGVLIPVTIPGWRRPAWRHSDVRLPRSVGRIYDPARAERLLRPRLLWLTCALGERLIGAVCLFLAVVLVLPIPFGNMLPAAAISLLALGVLERDGLWVIAGLITAAAGTALARATSGNPIAARVRALSSIVISSSSKPRAERSASSEPIGLRIR